MKNLTTNSSTIEDFNALEYVITIHHKETGYLLVSAANISLSYSLQQAPKALAQKAARAALKNFGATLEQVARKKFTREKEERLRFGLRKLAAALKPFRDEFDPLYRKD